MSGEDLKGFQGLEINETASYTRGGRATIDFDGSPTAYAPVGSHLPAQDYLPNAGHEGNWWALVTDNGQRDGTPVINPQTGYYISTTAWGRSHGGTREYVNADEVPYVAITQADRDQHGIKYGDFILLTNDQTGRQTWAIAADYAGSRVERNNHSEVSAAAARALGIDYTKRGIRGPSASQRGETTITMQFFPGTKIQGFFPSDSQSAQRVALGPETYRQQTLVAMSNTSGGQTTLVASAETHSLSTQASRSFQPGRTHADERERTHDDALAQTQLRDIQATAENTLTAGVLPHEQSSTEDQRSVIASGLMGDGDTGKVMGLLVAVFLLREVFGDQEDSSPNSGEFEQATGHESPTSLAMIDENVSDTNTGGEESGVDRSAGNQRTLQRSPPTLT